MPQLTINKIPIEFPFEPYDVQKDYMTKVIECLDAGGNAVLESPNGTGKTMSLLCSVFAWKIQKKEIAEKQSPADAQFNLNDDKIVTLIKNDNPKIIYSSRTHSQLSQVIAEFKQSAYGDMKMAIIASREQLCINKEYEHENNEMKTELCHIQSKSRPPKCDYYRSYINNPELSDSLNKKSNDIEDLYKNGNELKCCPYYAAKDQIESADIIFMPYNYIVDPRLQMLTNLSLKDAIIIIDEAHNIGNKCEEAASATITTIQIQSAIGDLDRISEYLNKEPELMQKYMDEEYSFDKTDIKDLKTKLEKLEQAIENQFNCETFDGTKVFELLEEADIEPTNGDIITDKIGNCIRFLTTLSTITTDGLEYKRAVDLPSFRRFLFVVFSAISYNDMNDDDDDDEVEDVHIKKKFKIYIENSFDNGKTLHFHCVSPSIRMNQILKNNVHSIILTSGTLSPMETFISELGIPIEFTLENSHIIKDFQVFVNIFKHGPNEVLLNSRYYERNSQLYITSLGEMIIQFVSNVPDGVLVFFSSYERMQKMTDQWKETPIWSRIKEIKLPIIEDRKNGEEFREGLNNYVKEIQRPDGNGAIYFGVLRAKVSEGLNFADKYGRAVIVIGFPLAPCFDSHVVLKKKYLDENQNDKNKLPSGESWYYLDAVRAVNPAIGRVIRHQHDYGAILLCDDRFETYKHLFSSWFQKHIQFNSFDSIDYEMKQFYEQAKLKLPPPKEISTEEVLSECIELAELETNKEQNIVDQSPMVTIHERNRKRSSDIQEMTEAKVQRNLFKEPEQSASNAE